MMEQTTTPATLQLVIRIADDSLAFALRDSGSRNISYELYDMKVGISTAANLREALASPSPDRSRQRASYLLDMARGSGADMTVTAIIGSPTLLIPIDDYDESEAREQYAYVYPGSGKKLICASVLPSFKTVAVFAVSKDLNTVLSDNFGSVRLEPIMARMWEFLLQRSGNDNNKKLYAYFHGTQMELCSFARRRFAFANSFSVTDINDALYFLLGTWKQIGADGNRDDLFLTGKIPDRDALTNDARRFLRRVYYINPVADFNRAAFTQVENMPFDMMLQFV